MKQKMGDISTSLLFMLTTSLVNHHGVNSLKCYTTANTKGGEEVYGDAEFNSNITCPLGVNR